MKFREKLITLYKEAIEERATKLVKLINKHAWVPIRDESFAAKLISERLPDKLYNAPLWNNLTNDKSSTKLFSAPRTDPTLPIVMVKIDFLLKRKGNPIRQDGPGKSVQNILDLINSGKKLENVPGYSIKRGIVEEGNHRVEALKQLGYKSIPAEIWDGWD